MRLRIFLGIALCLAAGAPAEEAELPEVAKPGANLIQRPMELGFLFRKLKALEAGEALAGGRGAGEPKRVSILEIGDSHLQGDQFSRPFRLAMAKRFGLAGRGLVFPYGVAHTSNAADLLSESNVSWLSRRSAVAAPAGLEGLDTGLAGFSIMTRDAGYVLRMGVTRPEARFDTLSIFSRREAKSYGMRVSEHDDPEILRRKHAVPKDRLHLVAAGDTLGKLAAQYGVGLKELRAWNRVKNDQIFAGENLIVRKEEEAAPGAPIEGFRDLAEIPGGASPALSVTVRLKAEASDIFLRGFKDAEGEDEAVIYGLSLERAGAPGLLIHSAGVNGAQLKSFSRSLRFMKQARCLDPDLVIIALGTNEAMNEELGANEIEDNLLAIVGGLTHQNPKYVAFLIVTPPDVLDWQGRLNPRAAAVARRLRDFAARHGLALWDWNEIMGGQGSVVSWRESHLVLSDGVHMSSAGYLAQSRMLYRALMDAYERY
jgi:lysophospholipase L1-like esterase